MCVCVRALLGYMYTYIRLNTLLLLAREDMGADSRDAKRDVLDRVGAA